MPKISLRKLPYPYRAALAICSDIDNTASSEIFLELMKFLNTEQMTRLGKGLGLEIGSSCWLYNGTSFPQLTYFEGLSDKPSAFAARCRELWRSGHIDTLHTYGDFDEGGFKREYAEKGLAELGRHGARLPVWVDHGNWNNLQNLGRFDFQFGADPAQEAYHFDLLQAYGVRYIWSGRMTHVLGQDASRTLSIRVKNLIQQWLLRTKYRHYHPSLLDLSNRLCMVSRLQDDRLVWDFQRFVNLWGREQVMDIFDLGRQISPRNMRRLIRNRGLLVVYTSMCRGLYTPDQFPSALRRALQVVAELSRAGELLVTTTSRLLRWYEISRLSWEVHRVDGRLLIQLSPTLTVLDQPLQLTPWHLQGLTFYCGQPANVRVLFNGRELPVVCNPPDHTHQPSVSIPWQKLEYPDDL